MSRKIKTGDTAARRKPRAARPAAAEASRVMAAAGQSALDRDEIARRAYALYLERGAEHGDDLGDWLRAERELQRGHA